MIYDRFLDPAFCFVLLISSLLLGSQLQIHVSCVCSASHWQTAPHTAPWHAGRVEVQLSTALSTSSWEKWSGALRGQVAFESCNISSVRNEMVLWAPLPSGVDGR